MSMEELMLLNCGAGQNSWGSLGQQSDPTSQSQRKLTLSIHWKDWYWSSNTLVTWWKEPTYWKRPWFWERLKAKGEGSGKGWDSWVASLTQWTSAGASSGRWWRTGKPGVLQSMGLQRVKKTEQLNNNNKCWAKWWSLILQDNMV